MGYKPEGIDFLVAYFPLKIFLGQADLGFVIKGFLIQIVWFLFLFYLLGKVWRAGLKQYEAIGT